MDEEQLMGGRPTDDYRDDLNYHNEDSHQNDHRGHDDHNYHDNQDDHIDKTIKVMEAESMPMDQGQLMGGRPTDAYQSHSW